MKCKAYHKAVQWLKNGLDPGYRFYQRSTILPLKSWTWDLKPTHFLMWPDVQGQEIFKVPNFQESTGESLKHL